jgi:hypothetical protein
MSINEFILKFPTVSRYCLKWKMGSSKGWGWKNQEKATESKRTKKYRQKRRELSRNIMNRVGMRELISINTSLGLLNRSEEQIDSWRKNFRKTINQPNSKFMKHVEDMNEQNKYKIKKYKTGWFITKDGRHFWHRSGTELEVMKWLDKTHFKWDFEREKVLIKSLGKKHIPDFWIYNLKMILNPKGDITNISKELEHKKQLKKEGSKWNVYIVPVEDIQKILKLNPSNKCECLKIIKIAQSATERVIAGSTTIHNGVGFKRTRKNSHRKL